jgi:hypothetical protein
MNEATKRVLQRSVRVLKTKGMMGDKDVKTVILGIEKLLKGRHNPLSKIKRA